jgi:hypothetical protein
VILSYADYYTPKVGEGSSGSGKYIPPVYDKKSTRDIWNKYYGVGSDQEEYLSSGGVDNEQLLRALSGMQNFKAWDEGGSDDQDYEDLDDQYYEDLDEYDVGRRGGRVVDKGKTLTIFEYFNRQGKTLGGSNSLSLSETLGRK